MGGSAPDPKSKRKRLTKEERIKRLKEIALFIEHYLWRLKNDLKVWGDPYARCSAIDWLTKIIEKCEEYNEISIKYPLTFLITSHAKEIRKALTEKKPYDLKRLENLIQELAEHPIGSEKEEQ